MSLRWIPRSRGNIDATLTESGNARTEQLLVVLTESDQQRMAARRALEWIGASEAQLVFRYEISDLFSSSWEQGYTRMRSAV